MKSGSAHVLKEKIAAEAACIGLHTIKNEENKYYREIYNYTTVSLL